MSISMSALPSSREFVTRLLASLPANPPTDTEASPLKDAPESVKKQLLSLQVLFPNEFLPALDLLDRRLVSRFLIGIEDAPSSNASTSNATTTATGDVHMPDAPPIPISNSTTAPAAPSSRTVDTVHYVRSAQHRTSRFSASYDSTTSYEVRLRAWNCTCPAFAFAAFPALHPEPPLPLYVAPSMDTRPHPTATDDEDRDRDRVVAEDAEPDTYAAVQADADADADPPPPCRFGGVSAAPSMPPVCKHLLACVLAEHCPALFGRCVEERSVGVESVAGWAAGWGDV